MVQFVGVVIFMAVMNRIAGVDEFKDGLPGRPLWYVTPGVAMAAYVVTDNVWLALGFAASFLIWRTPAWGYLITLGYYTPKRAPTKEEAVLLKLAHGSYFAALAMRMALILPAMALLAFIHKDFIYVMMTIPLAFLMAGAYAVAWRVFPKSAIPAADFTCGGIWAAMMAASH